MSALRLVLVAAALGSGLLLAGVSPVHADPAIAVVASNWKFTPDTIQVHAGVPRLQGTLRVQSTGDAGAFLLVLGGRYEARAAGAAHACEIATGHRIAQATARDLLSHMGRSLERSYRERTT